MKRRTRGEPTLPLINIVFLMLVFFLAAAQLTRPIGNVRLVETTNPDVVPPADAVVVHRDGGLEWQGKATSLTDLSGLFPVEQGRILPDRDASAHVVLDVARALRDQGAKNVFLVTERAVP